jgi:hypothetical protein
MFCVRSLAAAFAASLLTLTTLPASAKLLIEIDKSTQLMTVSQDGARLYTWPVSTGQRGYDTPGGAFTPFRMEKHHFSREWDDAPMPNSIFFTKRGHAIHGTEHVRNIGRPASHGCVRLQPQNAQMLFDLVKREGMANTRVVLVGTIPGGGAPAVARRAPGYWQDDGFQRSYEEDVPTGSVPQDRRVYRERYPYRAPAYGYREYAPREPQPYYLPAPRPYGNWN